MTIKLNKMNWVGLLKWKGKNVERGWIKNDRAERNLKFVWEKQGLEVWDGLVLVSSLSTTQQSSGRSLKKRNK